MTLIAPFWTFCLWSLHCPVLSWGTWCVNPSSVRSTAISPCFSRLYGGTPAVCQAPGIFRVAVHQLSLSRLESVCVNHQYKWKVSGFWCSYKGHSSSRPSVPKLSDFIFPWRVKGLLVSPINGWELSPRAPCPFSSGSVSPVWMWFLFL